VADLNLSSVPSTEGYVQNQITGEDPYVQAILSKYASQEKPLDIYSKLETEAGIPQLRTTAGTLMKEVGNVEDILSSIEPDVSARTRESLVTEAQRRGIVQAKSEPWTEKLTKLGTSLGRVMEGLGLAREDVSTKTALALQGQELELKPLEFAYAVKVDRNARLTTGFTEDRETLLTQLLNNWQRTNTIEDRDYQQIALLARDEKSYINTLQKMALNAGVSISGNESYTDLLSKIGSNAAGTVDFDNYRNEYDNFNG